MKILPFLHFLNTTVTLPNPQNLSKKLRSMDGFQYLHISSLCMRIFDVINKLWRQEDAER